MIHSTSKTVPVAVVSTERPKPETSPDLSLPEKLEQILAGNNVDCKRAVIVMIEAAHRKMLREPSR